MEPDGHGGRGAGRMTWSGQTEDWRDAAEPSGGRGGAGRRTKRSLVEDTEGPDGGRGVAGRRTRGSWTNDQELEQVCIYLYCINIS